jgi:hypothetical protein
VTGSRESTRHRHRPRDRGARHGRPRGDSAQVLGSGALPGQSDIGSFFTASGKHLFKSRIIVSTTDKRSLHVEQALEQQQVPVTRLRVQDLAGSPVDWSQFTFYKPEEIRLAANLGIHYVSLWQHLKALEDKGLLRMESRVRGRAPTIVRGR